MLLLWLFVISKGFQLSFSVSLSLLSHSTSCAHTGSFPNIHLPSCEQVFHFWAAVTEEQTLQSWTAFKRSLWFTGTHNPQCKKTHAFNCHKIGTLMGVAFKVLFCIIIYHLFYVENVLKKTKALKTSSSFWDIPRWCPLWMFSNWVCMLYIRTNMGVPWIPSGYF